VLRSDELQIAIASIFHRAVEKCAARILFAISSSPCDVTRWLDEKLKVVDAPSISFLNCDQKITRVF
jgi:hypothetical protein